MLKESEVKVHVVGVEASGKSEFIKSFEKFLIETNPSKEKEAFSRNFKSSFDKLALKKLGIGFSSFQVIPTHFKYIQSIEKKLILNIFECKVDNPIMKTLNNSNLDKSKSKEDKEIYRIFSEVNFLMFVIDPTHDIEIPTQIELAKKALKNYERLNSSSPKLKILFNFTKNDGIFQFQEDYFTPYLDAGILSKKKGLIAFVSSSEVFIKKITTDHTLDELSQAKGYRKFFNILMGKN